MNETKRGDRLGSIPDANEERNALRDFLAAHAMQAMLSAQIKALGDATIPNVAKDAYRMADGMLEARQQ